ncbi:MULTISPECIES: hypothetical protein [Enterococcus]|uniref:hypothetical protein n=1 Tax=Enterococcus TaxID=1350 RepID=UPI000C317ABE|nr:MULTISPECIES: hypothetical protein [Enterococcus]AUC72461.1 hypothetical protein CWE29_04795 [Enterococcus faecium]MCW8794430.1 hypothetical protein [Enterococcus faecium]MDT2324189.1 hypothetical protein [Enterococcus faecium]MDV4992822.1 hypothetical protein [Enterococcus faecium]WCG57585.1 hypothetical protein PML93_08290 [Enterococcus faecium]
MKVLIISMFPKEEVPYIKFYTDELEKSKTDYDVFFWNREYTATTQKVKNEIFFNLECKMGGKKHKKIFKMLKYATTIRKEARSSEYTHIIVLTTVPGMFIFDVLLRKYRQKYIFDIRDYTNESNSIYYAIEKKLIFNSAFTTISSRGFEKFLPKYPYILTHNISNETGLIDDIEDLRKKDNIVIGFVGNVRYPNENEQLIRQMSKNGRFKIAYWGKTTVDFDRFIEHENYQDVDFHGKFINEEKDNIYQEIDMINAIYGSNGLEVTTAIPNRFYDSLIFKKPIISSKDTYLGELVENYGIGLTVDVLHEDIEEKISNYVNTFDKDDFLRRSNIALKQILDEQTQFSEAVDNFLNNEIKEKL